VLTVEATQRSLACSIDHPQHYSAGLDTLSRIRQLSVVYVARPPEACPPNPGKRHTYVRICRPCQAPLLFARLRPPLLPSASSSDPTTIPHHLAAGAAVDAS
jgi:hypothetical protein